MRRKALYSLIVALACAHPARVWGDGAASVIRAQFEGISSTNYPNLRPPDPHGAVGPGGVLQAINLFIQYWTKAGDPIWGVNFAQFFASTGNTGTGLSDPRALYDRDAGRFYVVLLESGSNQSFLNLAVSKGSDPRSGGTNDWFFYRFEASERPTNGKVYGIDYPGLGFDGQAVYATYNMFALPLDDSSDYTNVQIIILAKEAITNGTLRYSQIYTPGGGSNSFTLQPTTVLGTNNPGNVMYFAETAVFTTNQVRIWSVSDPLGTPNLTSTTVIVPDNGGYNPNPAPQAGFFRGIDTLSNRTQGNAFWYNGSIWFCHTPGGNFGKTFVYWYKVALNDWPRSGAPKLGDSGRIDGGPGVWTYQPSIGGNFRGDVAIIYCQSSAMTEPTIMYTARGAAADAFETPTVVKVSPSYSNSDRWGDYASVTADPVDESFWMTHEWARSAGPSDWGTWWVNVALTTNAVLSVKSAKVTGGNGNQTVDPNECDGISLALVNQGTIRASNVVVSLSSGTPGVTVLQAQGVYGNLSPGEIKTNSTFQISIAPGFACGSPIVLEMSASYLGGSNTRPVSIDSGEAEYAITATVGQSIVPGVTDIGNHGDDMTTTLALPFAYAFYGQTCRNVSICSNGELMFGDPRTNFSSGCLPAAGWSNAIFAFWSDLRTDGKLGPAQGIYVSTNGIAPNRVFNIEWRASLYSFTSNGPPVNFEARLYEGLARFDLLYGAMGDNGAHATIGCQKDATSALNFECDTFGAVSNGLGLVVQQLCADGGGVCPPPAPTILSPALVSGQFTFSFLTVVGFTYTVQYWDALSGGVWQPLQSVAGDGTLKQLGFDLGLAPSRFYRLAVR
jgi:hypothetical protein